MPAPNPRQVYEANMATFRSFRATIDDLKNHPFGIPGDQTGLVRRVQEWRKTIGHLTMWLQDIRAYYEQARPEIVVLLEHAFDAVSEVDKVRNERDKAGILKVADHDFMNILNDYIGLLETGFSPERQKLYSTSNDQGPLHRGQVLYRGLHSFRHRFDSVKTKSRQASGSQTSQVSSQPVSPITPTHAVQHPPNPQSFVRPPKTVQGNYQQPIPQRMQQPVMRPNSIPASTMVPTQYHAMPSKPQAGFIRPVQSSNPTPNVTRTQPMTQQRLPAQVPPNMQQASPVVPSSTVATIAPPPVPVETVGIEDSPVDTEAMEQELPWGLTWEELEALDRSEWDGATAKNEDQSHENIPPENFLTEEPASTSDPVLATNQQPLEPLSAVDHSSKPSVMTSNLVQPTETHNNHGPVPAQTSSAPLIAKEEAGSPSALLYTPPPLPPKPLSRLERRQSQLAAEVIDVEELSDDESSVDAPLAFASAAPSAAVASTTDVIDIDDSDEEDQIEAEPTNPMAGLSHQPPPATSSASGLSHIASENQAPAISTHLPDQPFKNVLATRDVAHNGDPATGRPLNGAKSVPEEPTVLPQPVSPEQSQPTNNSNPTHIKKSQSQAPPTMKPESHDTDMDQTPDEAPMVQAGVDPSLEDVEMANGERQSSSVDPVPNGVASASSGRNEQPSMSAASLKSFKDVNELSPELRLQIRQRAEEPLLKWHTASFPSMSWEDAKVKYERMSDQEVFDLYLSIKSSVERHKLKPETVNSMKVVASSNIALKDIARSLTPAPQVATTKRSQSPHILTFIPEKLVLPPDIVPEIAPEPPTLLCSLPGARRMAKGSLEFTVSPELMKPLARWKSRYTTPTGSHEELRTIELACYAPESFYPTAEGTSLTFTPNAQIRTWPDAGVLRAFVNQEIRPAGQEVNLWLSPPPFSKIDEPLDLSEYIQEGKNTIGFVHLGGMESFVFVVQVRRMPPPGASWSNILERVKQFTENAGYQGLLSHLSETIK